MASKRGIGDRTCEEYVSDFLSNHMTLGGAEDVDIERAHRSPAHGVAHRGSSTPARTSRQKPRPIHCKLLRYGDRQLILRNAAKLLKGNKFNGSNIYISDDVTTRVRDFRKRLREENLPGLRRDERVQFAYIPWSVPPLIRYKLHTGEFKTYTGK